MLQFSFAESCDKWLQNALDRVTLCRSRDPGVRGRSDDVRRRRGGPSRSARHSGGLLLLEAGGRRPRNHPTQRGAH